MDSKIRCFSQYYSVLQGIKRIMEAVLKRVQGPGNQGWHNCCSNTKEYIYLFFGVKLAILLLLCKTQNSTSQAQSMVGETVTTSEKLRDDYYFLLSLKEVSIESKQLGNDEPALGQKKKASRRIEDD